MENQSTSQTNNSSSFGFTPPQAFDFNKPEQWDRWIRRFDRFRNASGLDTQSEEKQVTTLIYCLGEEAEDIITASRLSEEQKKSYKQVVDLFTNVLIGKRNIIFERAKFNACCQQDGESFESFLTNVHKIAEHCNFKDLKDELIRDRIVIGILDKQLSESLQLDPELTLDKCVDRCKQKEAISNQSETLKCIKLGTQHVIDKIASNQKPVHFKNKNTQRSKSEKCWYCGLSRHSRERCPAKDEVCYNCNKMGHFKKCCKAEVNQGRIDKNLNEHRAVRKVEENCDTGILGTVNKSRHNDDEAWYVSLKVNNCNIKFKVDSGADVTVMPDDEFSRNQKLRDSDRVLKGAGSTPLVVTGMFDAILETKNNSTAEKIYVVKGLGEPLLGQPALRALNIIQVSVSEVGKTEGNTELMKVKQRFPSLFSGIGLIPGKYKIELYSDAEPYCVSTPRNIPIPMRSKVADELKRMQEMDIIEKINEPTDWCSPLVPVLKPNGSVRLCVDLTKLNKNVKRPKLIMPDVEGTLASIGCSKIFTKLDAQSGFWQVKLEEESAKLTTFITPYGRFYFKRLPFGISSAPEYFQLKMIEILEGIERVVCHMDDILIHGSTKEEHDKTLNEVLNRLKNAGITLNEDKCEFSKREIKFLGQIISSRGVEIDPERVLALEKITEPTDVAAVRRLLGMVNQMSKYIPNLADKTQPIRDLLKKGNAFHWGLFQKKALDKIIQNVKDAVSLAHYDLGSKVIVSTDSSSFGLGAVLLQEIKDGTKRPVCFASRSLNETEKRYAQIEKEALAITWACEKFDKYLKGRDFYIQTDHKPLVSLLGEKDLSAVPARIQRFRMSLMRYRYSIEHVPGKLMNIPDTLSRSPSKSSTSMNTTTEDIEAYVNQLIDFYQHATQPKLKKIYEEQLKCEECIQLREMLSNGWPEYIEQVPLIVRQWFHLKDEITQNKGILCKSDRLIIPRSMRKEILMRIHDGHFGITRCLWRAKESCFWPGITGEIKQMVNKCNTCIQNSRPKVFPMKPTETPERPWAKVAMDFMEYKGNSYIVIVDYYSRFIEMSKVNSVSTQELISHCKAIFSRHGIPDEVYSDSGSQFTGYQWKQFAEDYGFKISTSSPYYHQSNGEAERAVQTLKAMLEKNSDPYLALLTYRATPNGSGLSPAELLMGRKLKTPLPILETKLRPTGINHDQFRKWDTDFRKKQSKDYNLRHRVVKERSLTIGQKVFIPDRRREGVVRNEIAPRSYVIDTPQGCIRRNATMTRPITNEEDVIADKQNRDDGVDQRTEGGTQTLQNISRPDLRQSRYGRTYKPIKRLDL